MSHSVGRVVLDTNVCRAFRHSSREVSHGKNTVRLVAALKTSSIIGRTVCVTSILCRSASAYLADNKHKQFR